MSRSVLFAAATVCFLAVAFTFTTGMRSGMGRERPDVAAWFSADEGLWGFTETYTSGPAGPFEVGESRDAVRAKIAGFHPDPAALDDGSDRWNVSVPAESGGSITYAISFANDQVTALEPHYSVFASK
ncbi:hypothetical protein FHS61_000317 [Altererythrobacter atlanticus]|uniref:Uncharacterized protein n=1 Tax=Croceibacterium atlanticum TaxID=1267766 RepID=A0A0F7KTH6_9SPHN|nr:hypothetical protein [Croceibacterium atlanticum]AKH42547.1 hypothetical protein WYH_01508 [Croceibacterium atlanticum]MBB5731324.1 hypothetical protein [Croceibacterium atlanticum]